MLEAFENELYLKERFTSHRYYFRTLPNINEIIVELFLTFDITIVTVSLYLCFSVLLTT
jgi:hypothetical protein